MRFVCVALPLLIGGTTLCHSRDRETTNFSSFPRLLGGGYTLGAYRLMSNSYPLIRIGGDGADKELQSYLLKAVSERQILPETLPSNQDTNGNWGKPVDGMQLSVRFKQPEFTSGQMVPAHIILRNLGGKPRKWWRNSLPDNVYQFILQAGTNSFAWARPQAKHEPLETVIGSMDEGDPYWCIAEPQTEGLSVIYLNRFFGLSQPGEYSLRVQIAVPQSDGKGETNVLSGTARFEIVNSH